MRARILGLVCVAGSLTAQPVSFGVKAGVPFIDFVGGAAGTTPGFSATGFSNRYIVGATIEVHLPKQISVEADALYRHATYNGVFFYPLVGTTLDHTRMGLLEIPILVKYRFAGRVRPFVDGGAAFDRVVGLTNSYVNIAVFGSPVFTGTNAAPTQLSNSTTPGIVTGGGIEAHAGVVRISPELRYTRWTSAHFFFSSQNQVDFLVGITF